MGGRVESKFELEITMLKPNGPNSISKDAFKDEGCPWLINCTTQEYLVMWDKTLTLICPLTCGGPTKHVDHNRGRSVQHPRGDSDTMRNYQFSKKLKLLGYRKFNY